MHAPKRWRRQWQPTPVLLPGKSHGRKSLVGGSPWGRQESDMTERLHFHFHALEKEMTTHSSVLAWKISWKGEPGALPSMGLHRVRHDWSDLAAAASKYSLKYYLHWPGYESNLLTEEWMKNMWYIYTTEYCSAKKTNEINFWSSNIDQTGDCHTEWNKSDRKITIIWYSLYEESKK